MLKNPDLTSLFDLLGGFVTEVLGDPTSIYTLLAPSSRFPSVLPLSPCSRAMPGPRHLRAIVKACVRVPFATWDVTLSSYATVRCFGPWRCESQRPFPCLPPAAP